VKKRLLIVLAVLLSAGSVASGYADGLFNTKVAKQSFHEAGQSSHRAAVSQPTGQMAKVEAIMAKSKAIQAQQSQYKQADSLPVASIDPQMVSGSTAAAPSKLNDSGNLQGQISTLNQENLLFQQNANQRIEALSQYNSQLAAKVKLMSQTLAMLNSEINQLTGSLQVEQSALAQHGMMSGKVGSLLGRYSDYVIYGCFVLLLMILMMMVLSMRRRRVVPVASRDASAQDDDDTKSEYDFMNTNEAIPAKLDLAHAYMAMEDYPAAKQELEHILKAGTQEQKKLAQEMMAQVEKGQKK